MEKLVSTVSGYKTQIPQASDIILKRTNTGTRALLLELTRRWWCVYCGGGDTP